MSYSEKVYAFYVDASYLRIKSPERHILYELSDHFTFTVPGARHTPAFKEKIWDGKIRLYNTKTGLIRAGLLDDIKKFCDDNKYQFILNEPGTLRKVNYTHQELTEKYKPHTLNKRTGEYKPIEYYDFQADAVNEALSNERSTLLSPTSSGKSLIIYTLIREWLDQGLEKILLTVPRLALIEQMLADFKEYSVYDDSFDVNEIFHRIGGKKHKEKDTDKPIIISTWQSMQNMKAPYFKQFEVAMGDEAHGAKAKQLTKIHDLCTNAYRRCGLTGTLDGSTCHELVIKGIYGKIKVVTTIKELMDSDRVSQAKIKMIALKYPDDECKGRRVYLDEIEYVMEHKRRKIALTHFIASLKNNTLVLYNEHKEGDELYNLLRKKYPNKKVYQIDGRVDIDERERIRNLIEKEENVILLGSYKTMSTGISIKNLNNIVFYRPPGKAQIKILQSIGRLLRKGVINNVTIYDICDDLRKGKWINHLFKHAQQRLQIYSNEKYKFKVCKIKI